MTKQNEEDFNNAQTCYICDKLFTEDIIKTRDHSHISGLVENTYYNMIYFGVGWASQTTNYVSRWLLTGTKFPPGLGFVAGVGILT